MQVSICAACFSLLAFVDSLPLPSFFFSLSSFLPFSQFSFFLSLILLFCLDSFSTFCYIRNVDFFSLSLSFYYLKKTLPVIPVSRTGVRSIQSAGISLSAIAVCGCECVAVCSGESAHPALESFN